jgi:hypothetical protein
MIRTISTAASICVAVTSVAGGSRSVVATTSTIRALLAIATGAAVLVILREEISKMADWAVAARSRRKGDSRLEGNLQPLWWLKLGKKKIGRRPVSLECLWVLKWAVKAEDDDDLTRGWVGRNEMRSKVQLKFQIGTGRPALTRRGTGTIAAVNVVGKCEGIMWRAKIGFVLVQTEYGRRRKLVQSRRDRAFQYRVPETCILTSANFSV